LAFESVYQTVIRLAVTARGTTKCVPGICNGSASPRTAKEIKQFAGSNFRVEYLREALRME
jgi:hypothetical protein